MSQWKIKQLHFYVIIFLDKNGLIRLTVEKMQMYDDTIKLKHTRYLFVHRFKNSNWKLQFYLGFLFNPPMFTYTWKKNSTRKCILVQS